MIVDTRWMLAGRTRALWRSLAIIPLLLLASTIGPSALAATTATPNVDPNSVVPAPFNQDMHQWSEEGGWHWVTISHDGTRRLSSPDYDVSVGKQLPSAYFVATRVRTLEATDTCNDCMMIGNFEQGPPSILGGPENPALKAAYANVENGPRKMIEKDPDQGTGQRWTHGSWYLNYSPITKTFFSWTWLPDDATQAARAAGSVPNTAVIPIVPPAVLAAQAAPLAVAAPAASRAFPISGTYRLTQGFGCVAANDGYPSVASCPADKPSFHDGVDLGVPAGTPIVAAASGTVTFAGIDPNSRSGNSMIVIQHDGANAAFNTVYLHWQKALVAAGQHVVAGQEIAEVGSVGYSTGPHLHFSVQERATGQAIDPLRWLQGVGPALASAVSGTDNAFSANVLRWSYLIQQSAAAHNVPAALLAAIMTVESGGNPAAVSPAGAQGLMQIMPDQLTRLGVPQDHWQDPAANIDAAARYLAETLGKGGSVDQALARYFGSGCDTLGTCTDAYVSRVESWIKVYVALLPS